MTNVPATIPQLETYLRTLESDLELAKTRHDYYAMDVLVEGIIQTKVQLILALKQKRR